MEHFARLFLKQNNCWLVRCIERGSAFGNLLASL